MNLLLIVSDTFRWDYMGAYGNERIHTPNLDCLAAESAMFMDAYAEGLPTLPARRVMQTGRPIFPFRYIPQKSDGVQQHGWHPLFDEDVTLAEHLGRHGYCTALVTDVYHMMKPGKNFHRGFECWYWVRGQESDPLALRDPARVKDLLESASRVRSGQLSRDAWIVQHLMVRKDWKSEEDTSAAKVMKRAAEWIKDYTLNIPFYLWVDCFDPHEPWDPPLEYARQYDAQYEGLDGLIPPGSMAELTAEQRSHVLTAYAAEVTLVDRWVGYLLDALREAGRDKDTLVVFTSDHGTMMGERGELHKGESRLRNQCTRLPLLIRHPEGEAAGRKVEGFVQHQDIMPTVLNLMGLPVPERVLGRDVWGLTRRKGGAPDIIVTAFGHYASVRTKKWNLILPWTKLREGVEPVTELYDLEADPKELRDVIAEHGDVAKELSDYLREHLKKFAPLTGGSIQAPTEGSGEMSFDALPGLGKYTPGS